MSAPVTVFQTATRRTGSSAAAGPHASLRCSSCTTRQVCMPQGLAAHEIPKFEVVVLGTRNVRRGKALYRAGLPCDSIFAVRSGSFKSVVPWGDGHEQVSGLRLPGDLLGLDGIASRTHASSAIALEDSSVCIVSYDALKGLCRKSVAMQDRLHRLWGDQLVRESSRAILLGQSSASERVSAFLLDLSGRQAERGYSRHAFTLRMTREEIGSYLGMTLESVSRILGKLKRGGLIGVNGKDVLVLNLEGLRDISGVTGFSRFQHVSHLEESVSAADIH